MDEPVEPVDHRGRLRLWIAIGAVITELRDQAGLMQTELAPRAGLHYKTLATYEQGIRGVPVEALRRIASALGVRACWILAIAESLADAHPPPCRTCGGTGVHLDG